MSLKDQLVAAGVAEATVDGMDENTQRNVARSLKLDVPRSVEITEYKGANYIKTESFEVPHKSGDAGKTQQARNIFLRVEAVDQAIQDLLAAKGMLEGE